jgi:hypothetical protein
VKKICGFENIDYALKMGRCLNALQQLLVDARALCPDLCKSFTTEDSQKNVGELMHKTSYKIRPELFSTRYRPGQPDTLKGYQAMITHVNNDVLDDFRMYLSGRLWESAGVPAVLTMVDAEGNLVDETVVVAVNEVEPENPERTTWQEDLDPHYVPEHLRVYERPMDRDMLAALDEQIKEFEDSRNPDSSGNKTVDWRTW